jgi:hypothetical protein
MPPRGAYVKIDSNARAVKLQFDSMVAKLGPSLQMAFGESALVLKRGIAENFQSQGAHFGEPWQALAAKTMINKAAKGTASQPPLVDTRQLEAHLTDHESLVETVGVQMLRIGATDRTVHLHQEGTTKMPRRVLIGVTATDAEVVIRAFEHAVVRASGGLIT